MSSNRLLRHRQRHANAELSVVHDRAPRKVPLTDSNVVSTKYGGGASSAGRSFVKPSFHFVEPDPVDDGSLSFETPFHDPTWDTQDASWEAILRDAPVTQESRRGSTITKPSSSYRHSRRSASPHARSTAKPNSSTTNQLSSIFPSKMTRSSSVPKQAPLSPARSGVSRGDHSSSSSAYVGWPGTQDATGRTVPVHSSYDDSSMDHTAHTTATMEQQQISHWTAQTSAETDDFSSVDSGHEEGFPSPIRAQEEDQQTSHPQSVADFHRGAAAADARARSLLASATTAATTKSLSAMRYLAERKQQPPQATPTPPPPSYDGPTSEDVLRQPVPLSRSLVSLSPSAISLTNSSNRARNRGRDLSPRADAKQYDDYASETSSSSSSEPCLSKTSSAYLDASEDYAMEPPSRRDSPPTVRSRSTGSYSPSNPMTRTASTGARSVQSQPPTLDALRQNDHLTPHRNFTTPTAKGYRGLLDKTKEVPSLLDNLDSDSLSSSKANSAVSSSVGAGSVKFYSRPGHHNQDDDAVSDVFDGLSVSKESDVFDNLSSASPKRSILRTSSSSQQQHSRVSYPERIAEEEHCPEDDVGDDHNTFNLVVLPGGLTAIQTTEHDYRHRQTASDYDDHLSTSDVSSNGHTIVPGRLDMVSAGKHGDSALRGIHGNLGAQQTPPPQPFERKASGGGGGDSVQSGSTRSSHGTSLFSDPYRGDMGLDVDGDLSEYYVQPSVMKKVLRKYRSLSARESQDMNLCEFETAEDERKAFALFEMRSRIMEKDIERGLERRGGTYAVDDIVTTAYNRTSHRIRDAVIVSKAWRDGATISDVINTALLTRREEHSYFIKRPLKNIGSSFSSRSSQKYTYEAVQWVDDTDFMQYRCPSVGARHMRGFEIFTIGDCQSILLKLTNERCMELRQKLNEATAEQIEAEELLKEEGDNCDGMMTEAEINYLAAMEEVKTISKMLVSAEQAFELVRDRIQKLVARYENMLMKIETESFAGASSVVTYESSYYSDYDSSEYWEQEDRLWARRAKRAEIRAEIAAREALLAKEEARLIQQRRVREVDELKHKLDELQSEFSSNTAEKNKIAVKGLGSRRSERVPDPSKLSPPSSIHSVSRMSKEKIDDVKQRFRNRMSARKQPEVPSNGRAPLYPSAPKAKRTIQPSPSVIAERELIRSAGEEMCQQMDFYERSLKAVESARGY